VIEVKLEQSVKVVIIRTVTRQTPRINPPLLSGPLCHTLSLIVDSDNIARSLNATRLKHTIVNALSWLSSLRWVLN
jgi:hypothetical protein